MRFFVPLFKLISFNFVFFLFLVKEIRCLGLDLQTNHTDMMKEEDFSPYLPLSVMRISKCDCKKRLHFYCGAGGDSRTESKQFIGSNFIHGFCFGGDAMQARKIKAFDYCSV